MKAINSKTPHEFVTKAEKKLPPEKQTSFKVRFLTASQQAEIRDTLYNVSGLGKARKERNQAKGNALGKRPSTFEQIDEPHGCSP